MFATFVKYTTITTFIKIFFSFKTFTTSATTTTFTTFKEPNATICKKVKEYIKERSPKDTSTKQIIEKKLTNY